MTFTVDLRHDAHESALADDGRRRCGLIAPWPQLLTTADPLSEAVALEFRAFVDDRRLKDLRDYRLGADAAGILLV